jgi:hypothetical protein
MKYKLNENILLTTPMLPKGEDVVDSVKSTNATFEVYRDWNYDSDVVVCDNKPENRLLSGIVWEEAK